MASGAMQAGAANKSSRGQMAMYNTNRSDLSDYRNLGQKAINPLIQAMGYQMPDHGAIQLDPNNTNILQKTFNPTDYGVAQNFSFNPSDLENYPGYKFTFQQGMRGVDASAAARGLGVSGADIRGAADYTTGLAQNTFGQAYNQALGTYQTNYGNALNNFNTNYSSAANNVNRLYQLMSTGQNSAAMTANMGATAANNAGQLATSGAAAQAAGMVGAANSASGAVGTGLNYNNQNLLIRAMQGNQYMNPYAVNNASGANGYGFTMPDGSAGTGSTSEWGK